MDQEELDIFLDGLWSDEEWNAPGLWSDEEWNAPGAGTNQLTDHAALRPSEASRQRWMLVCAHGWQTQ